MGVNIIMTVFVPPIVVLPCIEEVKACRGLHHHLLRRVQVGKQLVLEPWVRPGTVVHQHLGPGGLQPVLGRWMEGMHLLVRGHQDRYADDTLPDLPRQMAQGVERDHHSGHVVVPQRLL